MRTLVVVLLTVFLVEPSFAAAQPVPAEPTLRVSDVWVKTTVPGGSVSAAYMHLSSGKPLKLVKVETSIADLVEIHDMKMKGGVMEMRAIEAVEIPTGRLVDLKPGGTHIMLMKLKNAIVRDTEVPLKLTFETANRKRFSIEVKAKGRDRDAHSHRH